MISQLIEFENQKKETLRGIIHAPSAQAEHVVIFIHGFERNATVEKKFKSLSDRLAENNIASFRWDASGCGLSDGEFKKLTIKNRTEEFVEALAKVASYAKVSVVVHSLGACVLDKYLSQKQSKQFVSTILLAPALNQKELLRYWFAQSQTASDNPAQIVNWKNYREHFNEILFEKDCARPGRMTKMNYLDSEYFLENNAIQYGESLQKMKRVMHIHGDADDKVPLESVPVSFFKKIIIKKGDHDLERPDMIEQWLESAVDFLALKK